MAKRKTKPEPVLTMETTITDSLAVLQVVRDAKTKEVLRTWELETRSAQIHEALIELGWTPPGHQLRETLIAMGWTPPPDPPAEPDQEEASL